MDAPAMNDGITKSMIKFRVLSAPETNINSFFPYGSLLYDARWNAIVCRVKGYGR
jgi:hypothetical protein